MIYTPKRGDIVWVDFDPSAGHEQAHHRPALVLSPEPFNKQIQLALVAPITSTVRGHGFEVVVDTDRTKGVVLCQQIKTIDFEARGISFIEKAPASVLNEALAKVRVLVQ
ncbi:TPA: type II toxin-antitoxin system PemK/MazF family toxin [Shewanella algae]|uniref:type II toxin-antitoxin system PemK/MazF family toxin n=1 Tax=Shewanella TaxID=22 RepID=UPI00142FDBC8|nr:MULTISPECIES: type II toxin-antitoxin system PemK/MazF family toxin [Shewanella]NJI86990.1 mRNA-degrading endonuclease [Shewanella sp. Iso12]HDS1208404.1 type II toxin-antitoxin system PemK/MazF family toxin [Shewanella algae]